MAATCVRCGGVVDVGADGVHLPNPEPVRFPGPGVDVCGYCWDRMAADRVSSVYGVTVSEHSTRLGLETR